MSCNFFSTFLSVFKRNIRALCFAQLIKKSLFALLFLLSIGAQFSLSATAQTTSLYVAEESKINLKGQLSVYRDQSGILNVQDILRLNSSAFKPISGNLSEGFTNDAVWVKFSIAKSSNTARSIWWLDVSQPLLFNSILYRKNEQGSLETVSGLLNRTLNAENFEFQKSVFEIKLDDAQPLTFYLRIQSKSAISTEIFLWEPSEFVTATTINRFGWGGAYGICAIIIFFSIIFSVWTRKIIYLSYAGYITAFSMASLYAGAWPLQFQPNISLDGFFFSLGFWVSLTPPLALLFGFSYLHPKESWPTYAYLATFISASVSLIAIGLLTFNRFEIAMPLIQTVGIVGFTIAYLTALAYSLKKNRNARIFLFAFSFYYVGACLRVLKNLGVVDSNFATEYSYQFGTLIHMLAMTAAVFWGYIQTQKEKTIAEMKLNAERALRKDQNNFIAMISHELRNPLSIISASTENLLLEKSLSIEAQNRISKISKANQRLSQLVTDYLHHEEILDEAASLNLESCDLNLIVSKALNHFNDAVPTPIYHSSTSASKAMVDVKMINMVIFNLVSNALRYSPNSSPVVTCQIVEQWFEIIVFNEGNGIPEKDIPHIFKKFFRGSNATGTAGSGLDLFLIDAIVSKHHGSISARNLASGGCEFIVRLPLIANADSDVQ